MESRSQRRHNPRSCMIPAAMFHSGSSMDPNVDDRDVISLYVDGMSCMRPRAPTQLRALGFISLSAIACALNRRQSYPTPKYRLLYLRNVSSYRSASRFVCATTAVGGMAHSTTRPATRRWINSAPRR